MPLYERVVAADRANTAALINLGSLYAAANRLPEAIRMWEQALAANPALTQARMNLAVAQLRRGERDAAIASLRVALTWDPDNPEIVGMMRQLR
jgi:tetratricopeptide (TPR) repeat protein